MSMDGEQGVTGEGRETGAKVKEKRREWRGQKVGEGKNIFAVLIFFVSLHFK